MPYSGNVIAAGIGDGLGGSVCAVLGGNECWGFAGSMSGGEETAEDSGLPLWVSFCVLHQFGEVGFLLRSDGSMYKVSELGMGSYCFRSLKLNPFSEELVLFRYQLSGLGVTPNLSGFLSWFFLVVCDFLLYGLVNGSDTLVRGCVRWVVEEVRCDGESQRFQDF